jgi:MoaA/NifB/PqqE/SkfB family radical SAM enzyme
MDKENTSSQVVTIDFHVTSECNQECPYCWGPQGFEQPVDTETALRIIDRVKEVGARRIVFTGGDPLKRTDIGLLIRHAKEIGLEVALSTTGDELTPAFLDGFAPFIDLISLPLDGASEAVSARTKKEGHWAAIMQALEWLRAYPEIDVKICTPVTRHNLADVPNIVRLAEEYARTTRARVFYNIFQTFPRSMEPREWDDLLVSDDEFAALETRLAPQAQMRLNFLSHKVLDRLYVMIFPDGQLVIPSGPDFLAYGQFLEIEDLDAVIASSQFDTEKHRRHSRGWEKRPARRR